MVSTRTTFMIVSCVWSAYAAVGRASSPPATICRCIVPAATRNRSTAAALCQWLDTMRLTLPLAQCGQSIYARTMETNERLVGAGSSNDRPPNGARRAQIVAEATLLFSERGYLG